MIIRIFLLILSVFTFCREPNAKIPPKAVKGVLDLRSVPETACAEPCSTKEWDFEKDGTINLDGEWEFYWNKLPGLHSADYASDSNINYIQVPGTWNSFQFNGSPVGSDGYAAYRLRILLPKTSHPLAFRIPNAATAYVLYVNGEKAASNGTVGQSKESSIPQSVTAVSTVNKYKDELEFIFYVSNFHYSKGGIWLPIQLGNENKVRAVRERILFLDMFLSGSILIMGLYHFIIFILRKHDKSPLFFGAYCSIIVLRLVTTGEKFINSVFPAIPFQLLIKLEYLSFYLAVPVFSHFTYTIFPKEFSAKIQRLIWLIGTLFFAVTAVTSAEFFTRTVNAYQMFTLASVIYFLFITGLAVVRKREGSKTFLAGILILAVGFVNDVLYNRMILYTGNIFPHCLLGFIFFQSVMLSVRFSKSFSHSETLAGELKILTESLEEKIRNRTADLIEAKKEIEEINSFAHIVNSLSNLNSIFIEISKYLFHRFGIAGAWLFLPDEKREYLYAYKAYSYKKLPAEKYDYLMNKRIPLKENEEGMFYKTFYRKKPFYLSRIPSYYSGIDREITDTLGIKSFLYIPLTRKDDCVGILAFSNLEEEMTLSRKEIRTIANLCSQTAGAVDMNHLIEQVEKARKETETAKKRTEDINSLLKRVNESSDLMKILEILGEYVREKFQFPFYALCILDAGENRLLFHNGRHPDHLSESEIAFLKKWNVPLDSKDETGIHNRAIIMRTPIFIENAETVQTESGKLIQKILRHKSFITLPIILENSPIGTIDFFSLNQVHLKEEDILELSLLTEQLAGIINSSLLFKRLEEEKEKALTAQLETETQKRKTEELNRLIKSLNEDIDIKTIMKNVYEFIKYTYNINYYALSILDKDTKTVKTIEANIPDFISKEDAEKIRNSSTSLEMNIGAHSFAFHSKKVFYIPDTNKRKSGLTPDERFIFEKIQLQSLLILPLILQNEPIGFLDLYNVERMNLSKGEITHLSILGEQLAGIIHGSNLFKQVQEEKEKALAAQSEAVAAKQEVEKLNEFAQLINSENNLDLIFSHAVQIFSEKLDADTFILHLKDRAKNELYCRCSLLTGAGMNTQLAGRIQTARVPLEKESGSIYITYTKKRTFYLRNTKRISDALKAEPDRIFEEGMNANSVFQIPLIVNDEVIGIMHINRSGGMERLSKDKISFAESFCGQLALAVNNSALLEETERAREDAEKQKLEIEKLNEFAKRINENFNLDEILNLIGNYIAENFNIGHYLLWRMDKDRKYLYPYKGTFSENISKEDIRKFYNLRIPVSEEKGLHASVCRNQRDFFVKGMKRRKSGSEAENTINALLGFESLLIVPLIIQNQVIGTMDFSHYSGKFDLTKEDIRRISFFCEQIAGVIHGASLLAEVERERQKSEKLLLNILPKDVASELKEKGFAEPVLFESVSVMFTDFKGFTSIAEQLTPQELIKDLDACFVQFDKISERYNLEKLKTIGDSYMCAGGIPRRNTTHAVDCVLAALEIQAFMNLMKQLKEEQGYPYWELRLGIHSGPLVAGVIGERKFAYDVWGDTVNTASRMESSGTPGKINISGPVHDFVKEFFECEYRGKVTAKNKGEVDMYYVLGLKGEYSKDKDSRTPNGRFWEKYGKL